MDVVERIKSNTELVMRNSAILDSNKNELKKYLNFLRANNLSMNSIDIELYAMKYFLEILGNVDVKNVSKEEMVRVISEVSSLQRSKKSIIRNKKKEGLLSVNTREKIKGSIKRFYKYLLGESTYYPPVIAWLKPKLAKNELVKEDLLTEAEVNKILEHSHSVRDAAMINVLFEVGCRCGELLNIRLKDINLYTQPAHITLDGKTGRRQVGIVRSKPALIAYLETQRALKPDDIIWRGDSRYNKNLPVSHDTVRSAIARAAREAGITKKVNPHAFRHSSATHNATWMTEMQLKKYHGWTAGSTMTATYVHLADADVDDAVLKKNGMPIPEKKIESAFKIWICTTCNRENAVEARFCVQCKSPKDVKVVMEYEEKIKQLEDKQKWLEDYARLSEPEDIRKFVEGKSVEEIQKEKYAIEYYKEHEEEIKRDYINNIVYPMQKEAWAEHLKVQTPEDKRKYEEWLKKTREKR